MERGEYGPLDKAPDSVLYDLPVKVSDHVYSAIGATQPPTHSNAGHNNNLSFVIGSESVLVVNGGANNALARALHAEIKKLTDLPVRYVISENGQGHAILGNHYWKSQDAVLIGHVDAQHEIDEKGFGVLSRMREYAQELARDTDLVSFDITFEDQYIVELGDLKVIAKTYGSAHSPGDVTVLVPQDEWFWQETWHFIFECRRFLVTPTPLFGSIASIILWTRSPIGLSYRAWWGD